MTRTARAARGPGQRRARCFAVVVAAVAGLVAACSEGALTIQPVIDVPTGDSDATASMLDTISLTVAHSHSESELVSHNFKNGQSLELAGVPFGDDLVVHMTGLVQQDTVAYGRTCVVSVASDSAPPAPHLFFSRIAKFASLDMRPLTRFGGLGISYLGSALLVGGSDGKDPVLEVEHFDPATGKLGVIGKVVARAHAVQAQVGTSPPRALVIGGSTPDGGVKNIDILDDHGIDQLETTDMGRLDLSATSLASGNVIVMGGNPPGGPPSGDVDEIIESNGSFDVLKRTAKLATPRSGHTATRLGADIGAPILIAGGLDATGTEVTVGELFKPLAEEFATLPATTMTMQVPRSGHNAALMPDGSVLIIGGTVGGTPVSALELFSIDGGFVRVGDLPQGAGLVDFSLTTLPDGRILLTGGRTSPGAPATDNTYIFRLNPIDGSVVVVATDHLAIARAGHQALVLCDGTVLITGGAPAGFPAERYNPPTTGRR